VTEQSTRETIDVARAEGPLKNSRRRLLAISVVALVALALAWSTACSGSNLEPPESFLGVGVTPPLEKPAEILRDFDGNAFDIRAETEGYVLLLYVGYTNCPDICPTHLNNIAKALDDLPEEVTSKVKVVFITADPERDTPEVLKSYLGLFDESFIGLTGRPEQIASVESELGIPRTTRTDLGGGDYAVNHAAFVMAYGADDLSHIVFPDGISDEAWRNDITKLALEGWE